MMPGLNGVQVLEQVRQTKTSVELPVIMVTAKSDSEDVVQSLSKGANDYVTKPIDFPVVLARVESQLRTREAMLAQMEKRAVAAREEDSTEPGPGKTLAGKYRLETLIGSGAFGSVYRARHVGLDQAVAVKVLQAAMARTPDAIARFQREGIAACRIRHPNAVSVMDFGVAGDVAFLVMELLEGHSLEEEINAVGRLPVLRCAEILQAIAAVLVDAHKQGIIQRDVKPANVFLHDTPYGEQVKVLDFGIAKFLDDHSGASKLT